MSCKSCGDVWSDLGPNQSLAFRQALRTKPAVDIEVHHPKYALKRELVLDCASRVTQHTVTWASPYARIPSSSLTSDGRLKTLPVTWRD